MTDPRRVPLANLLRTHRTWGVGTADDVDLRLADVILAMFFDHTGPNAWCAGCAAQSRRHAEAPVAVALVCDCGAAFPNADALGRHTGVEHQRKPTRRERTPRSVAA